MTDRQQDDEMNSGLGVAERDLLQAKLRELADTMPPRAVWQRIEQQARAEGLIAGSRWAEPAKWLAGAAIAATVAMLALNLQLAPPPANVDEPYTVPPEATADNAVMIDLNALKAESRYLEQNLRSLPDQPAVLMVSTATTIRELEERIAAIDYRLSDLSVPLDPAQEEMYWRERVRLMNLLVQLRYAQAQRTAF